jgi:hypothetical protein
VQLFRHVKLADFSIYHWSAERTTLAILLQLPELLAPPLAAGEQLIQDSDWLMVKNTEYTVYKRLDRGNCLCPIASEKLVATFAA